MSKDKQVADTKKVVETITKGKTKEELVEVVDNLKAQLAEHTKQGNYHQTMAVKANGAIEVLSQLIVKEEDDS